MMAKSYKYTSFNLTIRDDEMLDTVDALEQFRQQENYATNSGIQVVNSHMNNPESDSTGMGNFLAVNNLPVTFDFKALPVLVGTNGDDTLGAALGPQRLQGLAGNDTYIVNHVRDKVVENINEGKDLIISSVNYNLPDNVEDITLSGIKAIDADGNGLDNSITGNTAANRLNGKGGNDQIFGGDGNDTLLGGSGNDWLDGGNGGDRLLGGAGDDIYVLNSNSDVVIEDRNAGTDTIMTHGSYKLTNTSNVENLTLLHDGNVGIGNKYNNILTLVDGIKNSTLTGGGGDDTFQLGEAAQDNIANGGAGNDVFIVHKNAIANALNAGAGNNTFTFANGAKSNIIYSDSGNDIFNFRLNEENNFIDSGAGDDVFSFNSYAVGNVINAGSGNNNFNFASSADSNVINNQNGTGDTLYSFNFYAENNIINAGNGNDTLNIGYYSRNNQLSGGLGDDMYIVNTARDFIIENVGAGNDTVWSSDSYTLGANLENLVLTGMYPINGMGNALNNVIEGNLQDNTLEGGAGNDSLNGGGGIDTYVFAALDGTANGGLGVDSIVSGGFVSNLDSVLDAEEDILDLRGMFTNGTVNTGNIEQYLRMDGSMLQIDRDGGADSFTNLVNLTITNITTANLDELVTAGQILA